ncbi:putative F-box/FBD/LRR-repeat protein At5g22670 [Lotus japonicus]|uniref:putative F-box/FBD/LRR-repeat protein At5g22670 n=1 Tax=Lotus japonicus TaxID=34305 RepID=UPI002584715F|nr:putative F-box/FBD/LRR-repeat protein At5g22670 [Lotus japonicus]
MESRDCKILHRESTMNDRISSLPEELLCQILSFLPTKNVVATSVLSKKWKLQWRSVPTLDFDELRELNYIGSKEDLDHFFRCIYAFIHSRDHYKPILKFRLSFYYPFHDPASVTAQVNSVVQPGVEHLDISFPYFRIIGQPKPIIPPAIFTCKNLVVLKLDVSPCFLPDALFLSFSFLGTSELLC